MQIKSKMSSQESVGESRVSHPTLGPGANSDADHFGPSTEEEMEADLKRIDAMEEDQEVTSSFSSRIHDGGTIELSYSKLGHPFQC